MLLLLGTTDKLQVVTSAVCTVDVHASAMDVVDSSGAITTHRKNTAITTAITTDIVLAPGTGVSRNVKTLHISNKHASNPVDITLQHTDGTTVVELEKVTLLAGERLGYVEGVGCRVFDSNGREKLFTSPIFLTKRSQADHTNATTTATEVTDLSLGCGIGTWLFEYWIIFQSSLATTGPKLSVNYDGTATTFLQTASFLTGTTTDSLGAIDQDALVPQVTAGMAKRVKDATGTMIATGGVDTINVDTLITITGVAVVTAAGNFELWHGSETANSTIVRTNSVLRLTRID